jgi:hypothetical protein
MTQPGIAAKNLFQYGRETAGNYGVAVAATHRLPTYALDSDDHLDVIEPDLSDGPTGSMFTVAMLDGVKTVTVPVELPLTYTGELLLIDCLFGTGTYASNGGSSGAGPPYLHTFILKELLNSLTLQIGIGDIPAGLVEQAKGAKISRAVLSSSGGNNVGRLALTFMAQDYAYGVTPTSPVTAPATDPVMFKHLSAFNDGLAGAGVGDIQGWELVLDYALARREKGTALSDEFLRNARPGVTLTLDTEFQTNTARQSHAAMAQGAPTLTFTSGAKIFKITMPKAYIKPTPGRSREGMGIMKQKIVWSPIYDSGIANYLKLEVTNAQVNITA